MDSAGKRPRRLRAKYTPRTNLAICTRGISLLRRACVSVLALTDRGAAGNRPALSGVVPPLRRRDNIRGDERRKNGGERWHGTALSRCRSCPMSREEYRISQTPSGRNTSTPPSPQGKIQQIIADRASKKMEYDDTIVHQMIECVKVYPDGRLDIIFGGGYLIEERLEKEN